MTDRDDPLESLLSGATGAAVVVACYFCATLLGICLGAWSAGWDVYGAEACVWEFFSTSLGLRKLTGLLSFVGIGLTTLFYFKVGAFRWESLNALALLWLLYVYRAFGAGDAPHTETVKIHVPGWRITASVAAIIVVYVAGRVCLRLRIARDSSELSC